MEGMRDPNVGQRPQSNRYREENAYRPEAGEAEMSTPRAPSLLMRVDALHEVLDDIDRVLGGGDVGTCKPAGPPTQQPSDAEAATDRIGDGLDKARARLAMLRDRLHQHMMALR